MPTGSRRVAAVANSSVRSSRTSSIVTRIFSPAQRGKREVHARRARSAPRLVGDRRQRELAALAVDVEAQPGRHRVAAVGDHAEVEVVERSSARSESTCAHCPRTWSNGVCHAVVGSSSNAAPARHDRQPARNSLDETRRARS